MTHGNNTLAATENHAWFGSTSRLMLLNFTLGFTQHQAWFPHTSSPGFWRRLPRLYSIRNYKLGMRNEGYVPAGLNIDNPVQAEGAARGRDLSPSRFNCVAV